MIFLISASHAHTKNAVCGEQKKQSTHVLSKTTLSRLKSKTLIKMSDWDVVKQLAAEFQKVQASTGAQKLSDRNCVEVVSKLVAMGLLTVLHTVDGKEYLTPQQLEREIRDELTANKGEGRANWH